MLGESALFSKHRVTGGEVDYRPLLAWFSLAQKDTGTAGTSARIDELFGRDLKTGFGNPRQTTVTVRSLRAFLRIRATTFTPGSIARPLSPSSPRARWRR